MATYDSDEHLSKGLASRDGQAELWEGDEPGTLGEGGVSNALWDLDGRLVFLDESAVRNLGGTSPEAFLGKSLFELFGAERGRIYLRRIRSAADSLVPMKFEDSVELPLGRRSVVSIFARSLDTSGEVNGVHVYTVDTTERVRAVEELAQQNEALAKLNRFSIELSLMPSDENLQALIARRLRDISGAEVAVFSEYDPVCRETMVNQIDMEPGMIDKLVGLLGRQVTKMRAPVTEAMYREMTTDIVGVKKTLHEASFGAISRPVGAAVQALFKVDRFIGVAYMIEGDLFGTSLLAMGKGKPDPPKTILENFAFLAAVTLRRKRAEDALRESEELFSLFMRYSPVYTYIKEVTPSESRVLQASHNFHDMVGIPGGEMSGKTMYELFPTELAAKMTADDWAVISNAEVLEVEEELRGRSYTSIKFPIRRGDRNLLAGYTIDVTERKRSDEERQALEAHVQQAQRLESLGVLAGGIAHDFNNILSSVLGNADLALTSLPSYSPARENLAEIMRASGRAAALCREMLAYSGRGKFVTEAIDLSALIEGMLDLLKSTISKKAHLDLHLAKGLPPLEGDPSQLSQVIMNLVINASEALGETGGEISIFTRVRETTREDLRQCYTQPDLPSGRYITLELSDTGCGMSEDTLAHLFDPFFSTKFTGRGLGLSAVLGIVRGHKGALRVCSEPGQGTTFEINFPAAQGVAGVLADAEAPETEDWHAEGTVLLVDDEEPIRALAGRMLSHLGFTVLTAADGREAVEVYRRHKGDISLVVLDLTMPQMDGQETFRELRTLDPGVRVVMSSGYTEQEATAHFSDEYLAGFLQKPYTMAELIEQLRAVLSGA